LHTLISRLRRREISFVSLKNLYGIKEYSKRFGEADPAFVTTFAVAAFTMAFRTCEGLAVWPCKYRAATPATCGVAMDVPLIVFVAVSLVLHADVIDEPGANRSRQEPMFE
jgi:hypothetical protein